MTSKTGRVLQIGCFALGPIAGIAPLGIAALLHLTGFATLIAYRLDHGKWPIPKIRTILPVILLMVFIAMSCLWANAGIIAWEKLPELIAIAASAVIIPIAIRDLRVEDIRPVQQALLLGLPFGMMACFADILLGEPFKRWHKQLPAVPINAYDREVIALGLFAWPAALILFLRGLKRPAIAGLVAYAIAILFLRSHSMMVGMIVGLLTLACAVWAPKLVRFGLIGLCAVGFIVALPVGLLLQDYGMDHWETMQYSFRHRVEIWHFTAERTMHHPWFGLGLEGSRAIPTNGLPENFLPLGDNKPPLHPHNLFLQIWLELGIIGACLTFAFIADLIQSIRGFAPIPRAFALASTAAFLAIASFAFGIWQGWWLATLSFLVTTLILAARDDRTDHSKT